MAAEIEAGPVPQFLAYKNKFAQVTSAVRTECFPINFEFAGGGMGDYICWTPALQWIVQNCPWVHGRVFAPAYFIEFVRHFFEGVPNWKVHLMNDKFMEVAEKGSLCRGLQSAPNQLLNATGVHLVKQGFCNFINTEHVPEGTTYPQLDLSERKLPKPIRDIKGKYIVIPTGGTTQSRMTYARHWNPIIDWSVKQGMPVVFLGKAHMVDVHRSYFDDEIHFDKGIDLREKTTLLEAANIMKHAACTIGLDNGLLHLAACTDASIVFGYNIAAPSERRPMRPKGKLIELVLTKEELDCIHCQTRFKLLYTHNFKNCLRRDSKCIDLLFENNGERWKKAIEEILK